MAEYIECRNCDSPYCDGCNNYILSKMLHNGKFNCIMDDHHTIKPTADVVEVRHGEWVEGAEHFTNGFYEAECSECGNYIRWNEGNSGEWNYCPNCGADMRGERQ